MTTKKNGNLGILSGLGFDKFAGDSGAAEIADNPVPGEAETRETGKPLSTAMVQLLSEQYTAEAHSAEIYYGIAAYFCDAHLSGLACFFRKQAGEERCHAMKFFDYLAESNVLLDMGGMDSVQTQYENLESVATAFLKHEKDVTKLIFAIGEKARSDGDLYTAAFIEQFLLEQLEEVRAAEDFYKHAQLVGNDGAGLLILDDKYKALAG